MTQIAYFRLQITEEMKILKLLVLSWLHKSLHWVSSNCYNNTVEVLWPKCWSKICLSYVFMLLNYAIPKLIRTWASVVNGYQLFQTRKYYVHGESLNDSEVCNNVSESKCQLSEKYVQLLIVWNYLSQVITET